MDHRLLNRKSWKSELAVLQGIALATRRISGHVENFKESVEFRIEGRKMSLVDGVGRERTTSGVPVPAVRSRVPATAAIFLRCAISTINPLNYFFILYCIIFDDKIITCIRFRYMPVSESCIICTVARRAIIRVDLLTDTVDTDELGNLRLMIAII